MTTVRDLVITSLKTAGVIGLDQTPSTPMLNEAFGKLKNLISQWQVKRWMIPNKLTLSATMTGAQSYAVGPGQVFDITPRPDRLLSAYIRFSGANVQTTDRSLTIISAQEDYDRIGLKALQSFPTMVFYEPSYPNGAVFPYPIPPAGAGYTLFLTFTQPLQDLSSLDTVVSLPDEYLAAIDYCLAVIICPLYSKPIPPELAVLAKDAKNTIRQANATVPTLKMDWRVPNRNRYNIYSDQNDN
jgi:hypothetical protein